MKNSARFLMAVLAAALWLKHGGASEAAAPNRNGTKKGENLPAAGKIADDSKALMGSADYQASPEHPIGWRGDWTGHYPGATPPLTWHRRIKTPLNDVLSMARKPSAGAETSADTVGLYGRPTEWLTIGPYPAGDLATAMDREFIPGEAELSPDVDQAVGDKTWKRARNSANPVDNYPSYMSNSAGEEVAYAFTYLYSPADVALKGSISHPFGSMKIWLNGKVVYTLTNTAPDAKDTKGKWGGNMDLALVKGWNRVLLKGSKLKGIHVAWKDDNRDFVFTFRLACRELAAPEYETKNILWMSKMPQVVERSANASSPVVTGDRVFFTAEPGDLICMSAKDGKVLWIRNLNPFAIMSEAERKALPPDALEKLAAREKSVTELTAKEVEACNAVDISTYLNGAAAKREELDKLFSEKQKSEEGIFGILSKLDKKYIRPEHCWGWCSPSPLSDGKRVYAQNSTGVVACYTLEGEPVWRTFISGIDSTDHGDHASPVLVGNRLVLTCGAERSNYFGNFMALDADTGKEAWRIKCEGRITQREMGLVAMKWNGEDVVVTTYGYGYRVSDGKQVWGQPKPVTGGGRGFAAPVLADGVFYKFDEAQLAIVKLPGAEGQAPAATIVKSPDFDSPGAGPVLHDGLLYGLGYFGRFTVFDVKTASVVYSRQLNLFARDGSRTYCGCSSGVALAGKNLYVPDNSGTTLVLEPGREYKQLARNVINNTYRGENHEQEQFPSNFAYVGGRIFIRGQEFLYCVGEK